jgi:Rap1a immunity proteins
VKRLAAALTVATVAVLLTAASGEAPAMTVSDLAQLCSGTDHVSRNACRIYILGVTQGISVGLRMGGGAPRAGRPCVPSGISAEELEATVKKRLAAPEAATDSRDASAFIGDVLTTHYPCRKGREP